MPRRRPVTPRDPTSPPPSPPPDPAEETTAATRRVVSLDPVRRLTRRQQEDLATFRTLSQARLSAMDALARGIRDRMRTQHGFAGIYGGRESCDLVVGIPIPSLAFEYLLANDVFPLSVVLQLVAKWGSGKSGLVAEFFRWFFDAGGLGFHFENETKFSPDWFESIMGSDYFNLLTPVRCTSIDDWQAKLTAALDSTKKFMTGTAAQPGPGRTFPVLFAVDSIMGKLSAESQKKILDEGFAGRGFPLEALAISRYLSSVPAWMDGWPFTLVLVNHLKERQDDAGNKVRHTSGGVATNFLETFELELRKTKSRIQSTEWDGFQVEIVCVKNSLGPTGRSITTRVLWWEEEDPQTGSWRQRTVWDWDWSLVHLLYSILHLKTAGPRLRHSLLETGFHLECPSVSDVENRAWSRTLGMTEADAVPWSELGRRIRSDPKLVETLRSALRIRRRALLQGDYLNCQNALLARADSPEEPDDSEPSSS